MSDHLTKDARSNNMRKIRNKDTKPELFVRKYLHARGFRYTISNKKLPGKPDIVLSKYKTVILVHGCFWHRHSCRKGKSVPKTNKEKWLIKFDKNKRRDQFVNQQLLNLGYRVIVIWECAINKSADSTANRIVEILKTGTFKTEIVEVGLSTTEEV